MGNIVIKCFETPKANYCYDRHTNSLFIVNDDEYDELMSLEQNGDDSGFCITKYRKAGLLQESQLEKIHFPGTMYLEHLANTSMEQLILQVTQQCNLRCSYCTFSGNYYNRSHNSQRMSLKTAKKAIDFYLKRTSEVEKLKLSFYGGEPLLEFDLIKECVDYIEFKAQGKKVGFNLTTNGTLLSKDICDYFVTHNFAILISLDGDKKEHNSNRVFSSGEGSFDVIMDNLNYLKEHHNMYYNNSVSFNAVLNPRVSFKEVDHFYCFDMEIFEGNVQAMLVGPSGIKKDAEYDFKFKKEFWLARNYEYLKLLYALIGGLDFSFTSPLVSKKKFEAERFYKLMSTRSPLWEEAHHGGPCFPGIRRIFVTVDEKLFPCEKVPEIIDSMCIGTLDLGHDIDAMEHFLNNGELSQEECKKCWAFRLCAICYSELSSSSGVDFRKEDKVALCDNQKASVLSLIKEFCILKDLGFRPIREEKRIEELSNIPL